MRLKLLMARLLVSTTQAAILFTGVWVGIRTCLSFVDAFFLPGVKVAAEEMPLWPVLSLGLPSIVALTWGWKAWRHMQRKAAEQD